MRRHSQLRSVLNVLAIVVATVAGLAAAGHWVAWTDQRLWQLGVLLCGTVALTVATRGALRDAMLVMSSLVLGFFALEGIAHWREPPRKSWFDDGLRGPRPIVGFGATKPGTYILRETAADGHVIFDVKATIGDDLLRRTISTAGSGALGIFGDSFTFGTGLNDGDTLPQDVADRFDRKSPVLNLGFPAWSPAQNLATLQHGLHAKLLTGARRFVLMTGGWHIERTSCKAAYVRGAPRYLLKDGRLVEAGFCGADMPAGLFFFLQSFATYRVFVEPRLSVITPGDAAVYFAIVDDFVRQAKTRYGVDTTILVLPTQPGYLTPAGLTDASYVARLKKSGADILVDPLPMTGRDNPYAIKDDGHPTALANHVVSGLLVDHLRAVQSGWPTQAAARP